MELTDKYKIFHPTVAEHIFSSAQKTFSRIENRFCSAFSETWDQGWTLEMQAREKAEV